MALWWKKRCRFAAHWAAMWVSIHFWATANRRHRLFALRDKKRQPLHFFPSHWRHSCEKFSLVIILLRFLFCHPVGQFRIFFKLARSKLERAKTWRWKTKNPSLAIFDHFLPKNFRGLCQSSFQFSLPSPGLPTGGGGVRRPAGTCWLENRGWPAGPT